MIETTAMKSLLLDKTVVSLLRSYGILGDDLLVDKNALFQVAKNLSTMKFPHCGLKPPELQEIGSVILNRIISGELTQLGSKIKVVQSKINRVANKVLIRSKDKKITITSDNNGDWDLIKILEFIGGMVEDPKANEFNVPLVVLERRLTHIESHLTKYIDLLFGDEYENEDHEALKDSIKYFQEQLKGKKEKEGLEPSSIITLVVAASEEMPHTRF